MEKLTEAFDGTLQAIKKELENFKENSLLTEAQKAELEDGILWALGHAQLKGSSPTTVMEDLRFLEAGLEDGRDHRE